MSILRTLIDEMSADGSTSAHSIASTPGTLFSGGHIDSAKEKEKAKKIFRRVMQYIPTPINEDISSEMGSTKFDPSDVLSKLDAAQKRVKTEGDTTAFGLEDEEGNIVKIYVKNDQAEDFEKALGDALSGADGDEDEENSGPEIAEVLYNLKDRFDIVDADWPEIESDEEEQQEVKGGEEGGEMGGGEEGMEGEGGGEEGMEGEGDEDEMGMEDEMGGEDAGATSALQSVIDVMKADAEAKKAEADARAAEAKAKEAEYAAQGAAHKVKQEEQILDMEAYNESKKQQKEETKKLASLAKYQHDKASDMEGQLSGGYEVSMESAKPYNDIESKEEDEDMTLQELSNYILSFLRRGQE